VRTIAINVEKGGAGKTTIACHLAWLLADAGHRVLVLDLDRQCNATDALSDFESLGSCKPLFEADYAVPNELPKLAIYSNRMGGEYDASYPTALGNVRKNFPILGPHFDFCIIDTPPSWSWINFAALLICDHLIVPVELGPLGRRRPSRFRIRSRPLTSGVPSPSMSPGWCPTGCARMTAIR
jgi:chromosome partitioning protein